MIVNAVVLWEHDLIWRRFEAATRRRLPGAGGGCCTAVTARPRTHQHAGPLSSTLPDRVAAGNCVRSVTPTSPPMRR